MKPIDTSIIFAAGFGTRMHPITKDIPKPLVRIGDKTLLDHTLELAKNGFIDVKQNSAFGNIFVKLKKS